MKNHLSKLPEGEKLSYVMRLYCLLMADAENALLEWYSRYIGEPNTETNVYVGFGLFFAGVTLGIVGIIVFLISSFYSTPDQPAWALRELAVVTSAIGLPGLMLGIVVLLPGNRRNQQAAVIGSIICLLAVGLFVMVYPQNWNVQWTPDYSAQGVALYAVGFAAVVGATGAALVGHQIKQASPSEPEDGEEAGTDTESNPDQSITDASIRADIEEAMEETTLSWGGVEQVETTRLKLNTAQMDDIEADATAIEAEKTTTEGTAVDEAVSGLRRLQGREQTTAKSGSVEEQTAALQALRKQQQAISETEKGETQTESLLGRVRAWLRS
jgi:hypothetical protein